jgi:putative transposase
MLNLAPMNIGETFACYRPPRRHRKHTGSADMPERSSEGTERRTRVVRIFPDAEGCLRPVPALAVEARESRPGANRHPSTNDLGGGRSPGSAEPRDRACRPQGRPPSAERDARNP